MALPMNMMKFWINSHRLISNLILRGSCFYGRTGRQCIQLTQNTNPSLQWLSSICCTNIQRLPGRRDFCSASSASLPTQVPSTAAIEKVSNEISAAGSRLFAVVHIQGLQYKVTTNDLIQLGSPMFPDVGESIRLEKVLLVGGDNFTLLGRPLLRLDQVRIEATVIEKTISQKHIRYYWIKRSSYKKYKEFTSNYTILRINSIEVSPNLK